MNQQEITNLGLMAVVGLLIYIAYSLDQQPHYQIAGTGEVIWKLDTQTGSLERCYPKVEALPNGQSYIAVECDPDD